MNDIVGELIALAGGANKGTGSKTSQGRAQSRRLSHSDSMYHHIAGGPSKKSQASSVNSTAESMIPLGDDGALDHFNT